MPFPDARNESRISVNETLLYKDSAAIIGAFKNALKDAGG
jgi:hypothetical protein